MANWKAPNSLRDMKLLLHLVAGEVARNVEMASGSKALLTRDAPISSLFEGKVLVDADEKSKTKILCALNLLKTHCPAAFAWLVKDVLVVKTLISWKTQGSFHYAGPMIAISGAEIEESCAELSCLLARRASFSRLLRGKRFLLPLTIVRAHIIALMVEARVVRLLGGGKALPDRLIGRITFWLEILKRWGQTYRAENFSRRILRMRGA